MKSCESIFTAHLTTNHPRHLTKACASRRVINPQLHMFLENSWLVHVLHLGKLSSLEKKLFEDEISVKTGPFFAEMSIFGRVIIQFPQFTHQNLIAVIIYMFRLNNAKRSAFPLRKTPHLQAVCWRFGHGGLPKWMSTMGRFFAHQFNELITKGFQDWILFGSYTLPEPNISVVQGTFETNVHFSRWDTWSFPGRVWYVVSCYLNLIFHEPIILGKMMP